MWKKHKQSISSGNDSANLIVGGDFNLYLEENFPTEIIDQITEEEVKKLKKSRFLFGFDKITSLRLGSRLTEGNLSGGSDEVRGRALAWCARLLAPTEHLEMAKKFLERARTLGDFPEAKISDAFILSQKNDKAGALKALADIDSDASRSAGLMIVAHHDGVEGALQWMTDAGYADEDLDSDGKSILLQYQLQLGRWDNAARTVAAFSASDFKEAPVLHSLAALTNLVAAVPSEFRDVVLKQVPFEVAEFRLASDAIAMKARRAAHKHFLEGVEAAKQLDCPLAARNNDEYALWLELRDPAQSEHGKKRLQDKLRDPKTSLGFVHYALDFGIKLDLDAVERDIERNIAINGGMTIEAAFARYALAFTKPTHEEVATYITRHHDQLSGHLDSKILKYQQIELFSRAGLTDRANAVLDELLEEGIPAEQESTLRRIILESQENELTGLYKAQYEATGSLRDLIILVDELKKHEQWDALCEFGRQLFEKTHSITDAERLVNTFNNTHRSEELVEFLKNNSELLAHSTYLQMSYAWGLYNIGSFIESRSALAKIIDDTQSQNYRSLQVNLGVAMGDWGGTFCLHLQRIPE